MATTMAVLQISYTFLAVSKLACLGAMLYNFSQLVLATALEVPVLAAADLT